MQNNKYTASNYIVNFEKYFFPDLKKKKKSRIALVSKMQWIWSVFYFLQVDTKQIEHDISTQFVYELCVSHMLVFLVCPSSVL